MKQLSKSLFIKALCFLFCWMLLYACGDGKRETASTDPAFGAYISGHTFGVISANETIEIRFTQPSGKAVLGNELTEKGVLKLKPAVKGKLIWKDNHILQFIPESPFTQGETYTATLQLDKLFDVPAALRSHSFEFAIIPQFIFIGTHQNVPYNNGALCEIEGHFTSSDVLDPALLPKLFSAKLNGKTVEVSWSSNGLQHAYVVDSVVRDLNDQQLVFSLNGKSAGFDQKETFDIGIPSIDNFQVLHVRWTSDGTPKVTVTFSDPIDPTSVIPGFILLDNSDQIRTEVNGATLTLYPQKRTLGQQRLVIQKGIKNSFGYGLKANFERDITFESLKPAVAFLSEGNILPSTDGLKVGFRAVNLRAVDIVIFKVFTSNIQQFFQHNDYNSNNYFKNVARPIYEGRMDLTTHSQDAWQTYGLDLANLIATDPGAIYRVELHFKQSYATYPCDAAVTSTHDASTYFPGDYDQMGYDYPNYWDDPNYNWRERENPCHPTYYYQTNNTAAKNILATNIGLIVKANDRNVFEAFATDLRTAKPLSGVTVTLYNLQQQELVTGKTDNNGMVKLDAKGQPFLAVAAKDNEKTYLRLDEGMTLSVSAFDVSGGKVREGLKGFIYGERGVWRPGDTLFLNFILDDTANPLPKGHPVVFTLQNPEGQVVDQQTQQTPAKIFSFTTHTIADAPTGYYLAKVKIGGATFSKSVRIEAVKPNRLRIQLHEENGKVLTPEAKAFTISSEWLTGASAAGYKAIVEMEIAKGTGRFSDFPGFLFQDKVGFFYPNAQQPIEEKLNPKGQLTIKPDISTDGTIPGMLDIAVFTRIVEPGGDFSVNRSVLQYAPFSSLVGIKIPTTTNSPWLYTGENHKVQVASVDAFGKKVSRQLSYEIYEIGWSWWYNRSRGEGFYLNDKYLQKVSNGSVKTHNGFGTFDLRIDEPKWGHFLIRVCDDKSGHCTAETVYLDWPMSAQRAKKGGDGPAMLKFWADKEKYQPGDIAKINIPSSASAQLLISVESGGEILSKQWVQGNENFTTFDLPITDKMAPNIYVFVAQLQPHGQTANDIPIRTYGILPIAIEDPQTILTPVITTAKEWKPNEKYQVTISESSGRPMTYTLAIVDEGLLGLTNFKTPMPHTHFYSKEALGIRTWDLYNNVISAFGGRMEQLMAIGGGDDLDGRKSKTNLRFVPVVTVTEPITIKKGESKTHEFLMPNYVGAVRVMVVAAAGNAYGNAEKEVPVKLPLMVQTTLPRVLGPKEQLTIPVQLFAMHPDVKKVNVTAKITGGAKLTTASATATFDGQGEQLVTLTLETGEQTGPITIDVQATSGTFKANDKVTVNIRHSTQSQTLSQWVKVDPGKTDVIELPALGMSGSNTATVSVSGMPDINLQKRLQFLMGYPHGCLEQQVSKIFPQLLLHRFTTLTQQEKEQLNAQYSALLTHLMQLQHPSGGLRYWPNSSSPNDWGSTYALHFLVVAAEQGHKVPSGLKANLMRYQAEQARNFSQHGSVDYLLYSQVYRLYVLALAGKPELGAMNRIRAQVAGSSAHLLAAAYHLAGQQNSAQELFGRAKLPHEDYRTPYNFGSRTRDQAIVLTSAIALERDQLSAQLAEQLVKKLSSDAWMSTQEVAWGLIALAAYYKDIDIQAAFEGELAIQGQSKEKVSGKGRVITKKLGDQKNYQVSLQNKGKTPIYLRLSNTGVPEIGKEVEYAKDVSLSVTYLNSQREVISIEELPQGTDFFARVVVQRTTPTLDLSDLALTQIFPSGWEILGEARESTNEKGLYRDFRDDRVHSYFSLNQKQTQTFEVRLNATYRGTFYLPPVMIESMYAGDIGALKRGKFVTVY